MKLKIFFNPAQDFLQAANQLTSAMRKIMGMGTLSYSTKSTEALLMEAVLHDSTKSLPIAHLQRLAEGLPVDADWMVACPVHLLLQRDTFSLLHPAELAITHSELLMLVETLNQHFAEDDVRLELSPKGNCYLRLPSAANFVTQSPYLAVGQKIDDFLPKGQSAGLINRMMNEIQMLLFNHPVNQVRETKGGLPINGFWLYGEGRPNVSDAKTYLAGSDLLLQGLGSLTGAELYHPQSFEELSQQANKVLAEECVLVIDDLPQLETIWLRPIMRALRAFQLDELQITFTVNGRSIQLAVDSISSWKLWSKSKSLEHIIRYD